MDRRIDVAIESELGNPEGLPYLTGFVYMDGSARRSPRRRP